jgi:hypothetical protein
METKQENGWLEDATRAEAAIESAKSGLGSDRMLGKYYSSLRYARPTGDVEVSGVSNAPAFIEGIDMPVKKLGYNSFMEVSDGCTARVCQPLRPKVKPVAAKPNIARQCTLLSRVQDGVIDKSNFLQEATQAWEDAYSWPIGFVFFEISGSDIVCRRVDPSLVYYVRGEGRNPVHLFMDEAMSRSVLLEQYADNEKAVETIKKAEAWEPETVAGVDAPKGAAPDTVKVSRCWRRKIGDESGRVLVTCNGADLNGDGDEPGKPWPYDFFPFACFRNRWDHKGFGGIPMGRFVAPHHLAVNRLARIEEDSFKSAVPIIWAHAQSKVSGITDMPYQVKKWDGSVRPEIVPTNPVSTQVLQRIEWHQGKCYEIAGISRGLSTGKTQPGINSGVALREVVSLADQRASQYDAKWEEGWKQAGHIIVALANEVKRLKIPSVSNKELMQEIDLSDIKLERDDYQITYSVTSALSKTIPGLLADLGDFKDLGLVDQMDMAEAIGDKVPDIAAIVDRVTSPRRIAVKMIQNAIEDGEIPIVPSAGLGQDGLDAILIFGHQAFCQVQLTPSRYHNDAIAVLHRLLKCAQAKKGQPLPVVRPVMPAQPISQGDIVPAGVPGGTTVAHNQYEAASLGILPGSQPTA